jgi:hypothetical protein
VFAYLKHSKQPTARRVHLLLMGMGSPFLVDHSGKPKDNISVSLNLLGFGRSGVSFSRRFLRQAPIKLAKRRAAGHFQNQTTTNRADRSNPQVRDM